MTLVVDTSVAIAWFVDEPWTALAEPLARRTDLFAPDLIVSEATNVLWRLARSGKIDETHVEHACRRLPQSFAALIPGGILMTRSYAIARQLDHPAYDCFYVALAESLRAPLITTDKRLHSRTRNTPWASLTLLLGEESIPT